MMTACSTSYQLNALHSLRDRRGKPNVQFGLGSSSGPFRCLCSRKGVPLRGLSVAPVQAATVSEAPKQARSPDVPSLLEVYRHNRNEFLEAQALQAIKDAVEAFKTPAFPCALIAGDVVILELLDRAGYLRSGRVPVIFIDTFHLFPETHDFLHRLEEKYGFKAKVFKPAGFEDKEAYKAVHGVDLPIRDIEEYDRICKVEPFQRSLKELNVDAMINGRRRDHGAERAHLELFEEGTPVKVNPIAWWEFKDCLDFLERNGLERHPLHDQVASPTLVDT
eukprot:jgi/Botrbrau1/17937/Bobra.50_1s0033.2